MKNRVLIFGLILMWVATPVLADAVEWIGHNEFNLPAEGIQMQRPNDKWRVITATDDSNDTALVKLSAYKTGPNREMVLAKAEPKFLGSYTVKRSKAKKRHALQTFLKEYEAKGFQFYKTDLQAAGLSAEGVNADNQILMLNFYFQKPHYRGNYYILSYQLPRERYIADAPQFQWVSEHVVLQK